MKWILIFICPLIAFSIQAQTSFEENILSKLETVAAEIFQPVEQVSYTIKEDKNIFYNTDFILEHKDKVEIRIEVLSSKEDSTAVLNPHIQNGIRLGHLMSNLEESNIALHQFGSKEQNAYQADWGTQALFTPKDEFSEKNYCQLITIHKEEQGLIFIYLLFDDLEKYKDEWKYILSFIASQ